MTRQPDGQQRQARAPGSDTEYGFDGWVPRGVLGKLSREPSLEKLVW